MPEGQATAGLEQHNILQSLIDVAGMKVHIENLTTAMNQVVQKLDAEAQARLQMPCLTHSADIGAWAEFSKELGGRFHRHVEDANKDALKVADKFTDTEARFAAVENRQNGMLWKIALMCLAAVSAIVTLVKT